MKDKKLQLGLLIGATVLVVVIIMVCVFTGGLDVGGSSLPAPENQIVIEEISEGEIRGYYLTESGRKKQVSIPVADTVTVEDVNGQEIDYAELSVADRISVNIAPREKDPDYDRYLDPVIETITLLPVGSDEYI